MHSIEPTSHVHLLGMILWLPCDWKDKWRTFKRWNLKQISFYSCTVDCNAAVFFFLSFLGNLLCSVLLKLSRCVVWSAFLRLLLLYLYRSDRFSDLFWVLYIGVLYVGFWDIYRLLRSWTHDVFGSRTPKLNSIWQTWIWIWCYSNFPIDFYSHLFIYSHSYLRLCYASVTVYTDRPRQLRYTYTFPGCSKTFILIHKWNR